MSWDVFLGGPFNIANAALLCRLMALHTGLVANEILITSVSTHIYNNHFDQVKKQMVRTPHQAPKLIINKKPTLFDYTLDDFTLEGYNHQGVISAPVAV